MEASTSPLQVTAPATGRSHARLTVVHSTGPLLSALSLMHPELAGKFAEFCVLAGWSPAKLALWDGDPAFRAEVQAAIRQLPPAASYRPARRLRLIPGGER